MRAKNRHPRKTVRPANTSSIRAKFQAEPHTELGFWARLYAKFYEAMTLRVPQGYEDEAGFHLGKMPAEVNRLACL